MGRGRAAARTLAGQTLHLCRRIVVRDVAQQPIRARRRSCRRLLVEQFADRVTVEPVSAHDFAKLALGIWIVFRHVFRISRSPWVAAQVSRPPASTRSPLCKIDGRSILILSQAIGRHRSRLSGHVRDDRVTLGVMAEQYELFTHVSFAKTPLDEISRKHEAIVAALPLTAAPLSHMPTKTATGPEG